MDTTRRDWLTSTGKLTVAAALAGPLAPEVRHARAQSQGLPLKDEFPTLTPGFLNGASVHPMCQSAADAMAAYAQAKVAGGGAVSSAQVQAKFAQLINAEPSEIGYVPSTSIGENLVTQALDFPHNRGRIVTDALHFVGSFYLYEQLGKLGVEVVTVPMLPDGSISSAQFKHAITADETVGRSGVVLRPGTRLVAISQVSFVNGFEHEVRTICDIAHQRGALVYLDIIQAAGAVPVDVKAMDVDFAGCGTYKWLMGDFGFAFLYVKNSVLPRLVRRPWFGYLQATNFSNPITRLYPFDPAGEPPFEFNQRSDVQGHFNGSFPARPVEAAVNRSLDLLLATGVENIQAYRQPMIDAVQHELRRRGFQPMTPLGSRSPIVSFAYPNAAQLAPRLNPAGVRITLTGNRLRISPSLFNDMNDVDRLLEAIGNP